MESSAAVLSSSFEEIIEVRRRYDTYNSRIRSFDELVEDWDYFLDKLEAEDDLVYAELMQREPAMKEDVLRMRKSSSPEELENRKKKIGARKYGAEYKDYDHCDVIDYTFVFKHQWPDLSEYVYGAYPRYKPNTVHISSLKLTTTNCDDDDDEEYSLEVYGWVHMYTEDGLRYQELFDRERDESQILSKRSPCLPLTGPICPPKCYGIKVKIRGSLILKGTTEEDDECLIISDSQGSGDVGSQSEEGDKGLKHTTYSLVMTAWHCGHYLHQGCWKPM